MERERDDPPGASASKLDDRLNLVALVLALGFVVFVVVRVIAYTPSERDLPLYWDVPEFALVDQHGDTLRASELRGRPWVASFVFTKCTSVCPLITQRMAALRDSLAAQRVLGEEVRLVSFTVDPARDTPEVLREYAGRFGGSPPAEWAFLTGEPPEAVRAMIQEGFKLTASVPPEHEHGGGDYQVMHSPRVVLVDAAGQVRGLYETTEPDAMERLGDDLRALLD